MLSLSFRASRSFLRLRGPSSNLPLIGRDPGDICHRRYRRFATAAFWVYFLYVTGVAGVVLPVENVRRKRSKLTKSWGDPLSPLFHEGAQNFKSINLSILPRWVAGFRAAEAKLVSRAARFGDRLWGWFGGMAGQIKVRKCAVSAISPLLLCWIAGPFPIGTVFCLPGTC